MHTLGFNKNKYIMKENGKCIIPEVVEHEVIHEGENQTIELFMRSCLCQFPQLLEVIFHLACY